MNEPSEKQVRESVATGLRKLREERGLSQREVLYDTGIHIARIEARLKSTTIYTLKRLCHYYGISLSDFLGMYCSL